MKQARIKHTKIKRVLLVCVSCMKHVLVFIAFDNGMDPIEMATVGSGLVRKIGFNSFSALSSKGRRMSPTVVEAHEIFTPQSYSQYSVKE